MLFCQHVFAKISVLGRNRWNAGQECCKGNLSPIFPYQYDAAIFSLHLLKKAGEWIPWDTSGYPLYDGRLIDTLCFTENSVENSDKLSFSVDLWKRRQ